MIEDDGSEAFAHMRMFDRMKAELDILWKQNDIMRAGLEKIAHIEFCLGTKYGLLYPPGIQKIQEDKFTGQSILDAAAAVRGDNR